MSYIDEKDRGSTTEPETPPLKPTDPPRQFVFAHLIPSTQAARLAVEKSRAQHSEHHSNFITTVEYRNDLSTPCFELALDKLPEFPERGWFIGRGRGDLPNDGVDFLLVTDEQEGENIAGVHARLSWVQDAGGFFLIVSNTRGKRCTVNGEDVLRLGEMRPVPFRNTILIGELPFTLQYVQRNDADEVNFQVDLKAFLTRFLKDDNPFVVPTPRELDSRFGEWIVQTPIARGTFGTVYMVIHAVHGRRAAAKQLLKTKYNAQSIEREVNMAEIVSTFSHKGVASPLDIRHMKCQSEAEIVRIRKLLDSDWNPQKQGNITDEYIIVSPFLPGTLCAVIASPVVSALDRAIFFGKMLSAVEFLHANGLIHRDIKPENVLVESFNPPVPKLSDWGSATTQEILQYDKPGTIPYLAPEQVMGAYHGSPVDDWACGLIGYELLFKQRINARVVPGNHFASLENKLQAFKYEISLMPFCCRRLLDLDPDERMSAGEALNVLKLKGEHSIRAALSDENIVLDHNTNASTAHSSKGIPISKRIKLS